MYDPHTWGMATTRHRSLVGRVGRKDVFKNKCLALTQKRKNVQKTDISNPK